MSRSHSLRPAGPAIAVLLLLGTVASAQPPRVDAGPFIDHKLPDCGLQKAIDRVPDGGLLVIPRGTYVLQRSLVLKAGMTLSGIGPETVLTVAPLLPCELLTAVAEKGAQAVHVADASRFQPGMQVAVRDSTQAGWYTSHAIITAVRENRIELDRPLERSYDPARQAYIGHLFPTLYARDQPKITIQFLKITGPKVPTPFRDFVVSAIHLVKCDHSLVTNCTIEEWHSDGFSVQRGSGVRVMDNIARRNRGHGFHPGTGLTDSFWSGNLGEQNGDFGLYYCAQCTRVITSHNIFRWNARHGIGRLGDAGDIDNLVHDNLLEANGEAGVHVGWDRGFPSGAEKGRANFVVGNRCLDNGKAGVLLEYATENVIAKNEFRGKEVVQGKDATGNWIAGDRASIPAERQKLLDELLQRDARNMQDWAQFKKTLRAPP
jgi:parallel beta-helix repeat protein